MYWCIPKPEPVSTRPLRGHKTYLKVMRKEEVVKVMWRGKKEEKKTMVVTNLRLF